MLLRNDDKGNDDTHRTNNERRNISEDGVVALEEDNVDDTEWDGDGVEGVDEVDEVEGVDGVDEDVLDGVDVVDIGVELFRNKTDIAAVGDGRGEEEEEELEDMLPAPQVHTFPLPSILQKL